MAVKGLGCVLRAYGSEFDIDQFLGRSMLKTFAVWHKGAKRFKSRPPSRHSGANFAIGDALELTEQVSETVEFLNRNRDVLLNLRDSTGAEHLVLDFGITRPKSLAAVHHLPQSLILLAAEFRMAIEVSVYAPKEEFTGDDSGAGP